MSEDLLWYGYRHTNGRVQVKRFFGVRDLEDCRDSDFVVSYTAAFPAEGREDAMEKAEHRLGE